MLANELLSIEVGHIEGKMIIDTHKFLMAVGINDTHSFLLGVGLTIVAWFLYKITFEIWLKGGEQ